MYCVAWDCVASATFSLSLRYGNMPPGPWLKAPALGMLGWSLGTIIASLWVRGDLPGYKNGAPVHSPFTSTTGYRRSRMKKAKELSVVMYEMDLGDERGVSALLGAHLCEH